MSIRIPEIGSCLQAWKKVRHIGSLDTRTIYSDTTSHLDSKIIQSGTTTSHLWCHNQSVWRHSHSDSTNKSKDWSSRYQDNVSEWNDIADCCFRWHYKNPNKRVGLVQGGHHHLMECNLFSPCSWREILTWHYKAITRSHFDPCCRPTCLKIPIATLNPAWSV